MAKSQSLNNLFIEGCFNYGCIEVQDLADLSLSTANSSVLHTSSTFY